MFGWRRARRRAIAEAAARAEEREREAARQRILAQARDGHHWNAPTTPLPVYRPLMTPLARMRSNRSDRTP
jgi:hypothetical protein